MYISGLELEDSFTPTTPACRSLELSLSETSDSDCQRIPKRRSERMIRDHRRDDRNLAPRAGCELIRVDVNGISRFHAS